MFISFDPIIGCWKRSKTFKIKKYLGIPFFRRPLSIDWWWEIWVTIYHVLCVPSVGKWAWPPRLTPPNSLGPPNPTKKMAQWVTYWTNHEPLPRNHVFEIFRGWNPLKVWLSSPCVMCPHIFTFYRQKLTIALAFGRPPPLVRTSLMDDP